MYKFKDTIRKRAAKIENAKSNELKEIIKNSVDERLAITLKGSTLLGGTGENKQLCRVIKDAAGDIFLMPPRCTRRGYKLSGVIVLAIGKEA